MLTFRRKMINFAADYAVMAHKRLGMVSGARRYKPFYNKKCTQL